MMGAVVSVVTVGDVVPVPDGALEPPPPPPPQAVRNSIEQIRASLGIGEQNFSTVKTPSYKLERKALDAWMRIHLAVLFLTAINLVEIYRSSGFYWLDRDSYHIFFMALICGIQ